ncbi:hypothetical protein ACS8E2_09635 [Psychrobacter glaciei]|uniref:hypothetical protein n=1 Tax=Psychrobacter glaciei TaxID=619771 RepID=UPI003F447CF5
MNNLQPLTWIEISKKVRNDPSICELDKGALWIADDNLIFRYNIKNNPNSKELPFIVNYGGRQPKEVDSVEYGKHWAEFTHYASQMQPYVKPSPTKVYELAFDYEDGYFTVFMTTDKQHAIDFKESIKKHDASFAKWHGIDDDADEAIADRYNDTHPLKPYASKIFNSLYEDSFSEWAISYAGSTFASQLSIIEHELSEVTK